MRYLQPLTERVVRVFSSYPRAVAFELRRHPANGHRRSIARNICKMLRARVQYGFGPRNYYLFRLFDVPARHWRDYVPFTPSYVRRVEHATPASVRRIIANKALMYEHCVNSTLPTIPIFCMVGNSPDALRGLVPLVRSVEEWQRIMDEVAGDLFVKNVVGAHGDAAFRVSVKEDHLEFEGRTGSWNDLYTFIKDKCGRSESPAWIVQPAIKPHPAIEQYTARNGLSTVRAVTAMMAGEPRFLFAVFKITVGRNVTDNFSAGHTGNIVAAVDTATGRLACPWGSRRVDWPDMVRVPVHPDSHARIEGEVLPCWQQLVELAREAQASLPELKSAGWDIAIGEDGPLIVEANAEYDVALLQVAYQRGLRREIDAAMSR